MSYFSRGGELVFDCHYDKKDCRIAELERQLEEAKADPEDTDALSLAHEDLEYQLRESQLAVVALREALESGLIAETHTLHCDQIYLDRGEIDRDCICWHTKAQKVLSNTSATAQQFIDRIRREAVGEALELLLEADLLFMDETPVTREHLREILFKEKL